MIEAAIVGIGGVGVGIGAEATASEELIIRECEWLFSPDKPSWIPGSVMEIGTTRKGQDDVMNLIVIQTFLFVPSRLSLVLEGWREKMETRRALFAMAFRAQNQMDNASLTNDSSCHGLALYEYGACLIRTVRTPFVVY
jgi:hypothetical protein